MGFVIVIVVLGLSIWTVVATIHRLRRAHAGRAWWIAFALLLVLGLSAGTWISFNFEYQVSPRMRYASFPVPLAFFHLEDGIWVDFITPPQVMYPGLVANVTSFAAVALLPLLIASRVAGRKLR
jgi:hypothetical protein